MSGENLLAKWVDSLWTLLCPHGGSYARDCYRCIHETLYRSEWLAAEREDWILRISSAEVSGPNGGGSVSESNARVPRKDSGIKLQVPWRGE